MKKLVIFGIALGLIVFVISLDASAEDHKDRGNRPSIPNTQIQIGSDSSEDTSTEPQPNNADPKQSATPEPETLLTVPEQSPQDPPEEESKQVSLNFTQQIKEKVSDIVQNNFITEVMRTFSSAGIYGNEGYSRDLTRKLNFFASGIGLLGLFFASGAAERLQRKFAEYFQIMRIQ